MAPDRVPPELTLVRLDPLVDETPAAVARLQGDDDLACRLGCEDGGELRVRLDLLLHPPQGLDRVPVAILGRVLEATQELLVDPAVSLLHGCPQVERRRQLGEVEHPVDLPVAIVDVDRVLEQAGELHERELVLPVEHSLDVSEVAVHLGDEAVPPPVNELEPVRRQDRVEVRSDPGRVVRVLRHHAADRVPVLLATRGDPGFGRDRGGVEVAVDVLGEPVGGKRGAEPAEHVVAREPPATDVLEHRAERVRTVEVVVHPEEQLLRIRGPLDRECLVTEELAKDVFLERHRSLLPCCPGWAGTSGAGPPQPMCERSAWITA